MKSESVRRISQDDWNAIPEHQKQFYETLVATGKMIISDPELNVEEKKIMYSSDCVVDRPVRIHFMNKQAAIVGIFVRSWQYDILIVKDGLSLIIPKHSVSCIEEIEEVPST
jgi:hypothetical protein